MKKRKVRKDRKYKYRKKKGVMQPYYSKRGKDDPVKIWWWKAEKMSPSSRKRIPAHLRNTARPIVYKKDIRVDVDPQLLSNKQAIEELALNTLGIEGEYLMMMFAHRKNAFHVSPVKKARVIIKEGVSGLVAIMVDNYGLSRYWFWGRRK